MSGHWGATIEFAMPTGRIYWIERSRSPGSRDAQFLHELSNNRGRMRESSVTTASFSDRARRETVVTHSLPPSTHLTR
jgi:hypothetical protein